MGIFDFKHVKVIYMPFLKCNLNCVYCYQDHKEVGEVDVAKDIQFLKDYAVQENIRYSFMAFGGEALQMTARELSIMISILPFTVDHRIKFQTNLTLLNDEHLFVLKNHKNFVGMSTSLDLPFSLHDKYRCGTSKLVMKNIDRLADEDIRCGMIIGIHKETLEHMDEFVKDLNYLDNRYPHAHSLFCFMVDADEKYTLTEEQQEWFARWMIENNMLKHLIVVKGMSGIQEITSSCTHKTTCDWVSFHNGVFGLCPTQSMKYDAKKTIHAVMPKILDDHCRVCDVKDLCQGACNGHTLISKRTRSPYCTLLKIIFRHLKKEGRNGIYQGTASKTCNTK